MYYYIILCEYVAIGCVGSAEGHLISYVLLEEVSEGYFNQLDMLSKMVCTIFDFVNLYTV